MADIEEGAGEETLDSSTIPDDERMSNKGKTCSVESCENPAKAKGMCPKHYQQKRYSERDDDPEATPMYTSDEEPRRRVRSLGPRGKSKKSAKMPIPPGVIAAMGGAPFMLAGQVYAAKLHRSLDFTNPPEVAAMYQASLMSLQDWMREAGLEAPAWLVYAGTTATCIGMAVANDQIKLTREKELEISSRARPVSNGAGAQPARDVKPTSPVGSPS